MCFIFYISPEEFPRILFLNLFLKTCFSASPQDPEHFKLKNQNKLSKILVSRLYNFYVLEFHKHAISSF